MVSRSHLRLLAIPVFAGAAVIGSASVASAADLSTSSSAIGAAAQSADVGKYSEAGLKSSVAVQEAQIAEIKTAVATACKSNEGVTNVTYTVDGKEVSSLKGATKEGSIVKVHLTIPEGCTDTTVGLAVYKAPSNIWEASKADKQVLVDHDVKTLKAGESTDLQVTIADCNYQVDFFTGAVLEKLTATSNYTLPNENLIDADNGGTKSCVTPPIVTPPPVVPPVTPPPIVTPPPAPPVDVCPVDEADRISNVSYTINGVPGFSSLASVKAGDTVKVTFTIDANCDDEVYSLATYNAVDGEYTKDKAAQQTLFDADSATFGPGTHSLEVVVPDCFFQIDFVRGTVIEHFGPSDSANFYNDQARLIDASIGGEACAVVETPDTPVVLGETVEAAPAALAITGANTTEMLLLGVSFTLMGGALLRTSSRVRRNQAAA